MSLAELSSAFVARWRLRGAFVFFFFFFGIGGSKGLGVFRLKVPCSEMGGVPVAGNCMGVVENVFPQTDWCHDWFPAEGVPGFGAEGVGASRGGGWNKWMKMERKEGEP